MSGKDNKKRRRDVKKQVGRDNQAVFQGFMLEISAQPFWQRFCFCFWMAFKRHALQKSMKAQIIERKRFIKAQKIAMGQGEGRAVKFAAGFLIGTAIVAGMYLTLFVVGV